jgi:hypothetical protein
VSIPPTSFPIRPTPLAILLGSAMILAGCVGSAATLAPTSASTAAPTAAPTATLSPTAPPTPARTPMPAPTAVPTPRTESGDVQGTTRSFAFTAPTSWTNRGWFHTKAEGITGPTGIVVGASSAVNVPDDPCDGLGEKSEAATAEDVVADLRARKDLTVSDVTDTTIGGLSGLHARVEVPADLSACSDLYVIFAEPDGSGVYAPGPSWLLDLWILEAEDGPFWVEIGHFPGTPPADLAEAEAIVQSIEFTP